MHHEALANRSGEDVLPFAAVDPTDRALVGGKCANLVALSRIEAAAVPPGFCITTRAFERCVLSARSLAPYLERLSRPRMGDHDASQALAEIRYGIESLALPDDLVTQIGGALEAMDARGRYAVRSSATTEDLPGASAAGQYDTFLDAVGLTAILQHVRRCWASLFSDRAVAYRVRNGVDHYRVRMAVVVQRMVAPQASGVLFTADPVTGHRQVTCIEAVGGLGAALVSGLVNADSYEVRGDQVSSKRTVGLVRLLADAQILRLHRLGRAIEAHFGRPQDIEWCLADDGVHVLQSRPITTLYPVPAQEDGGRHVYISVGHQQMMTDAMRPLGLSFWQMTTPRPMAEAGGRLFVDVTRALAAPVARDGLVAAMRRSDPLMADALQTLVDRGDVVPAAAEAGPPTAATVGAPTSTLSADSDPAIVETLIARVERSVAAAAREIRTRSGAGLLAFIRSDLQELRRLLFDPQSHAVVMAGIEATWWLNDHLEAWLGEKDAADALARSAPHNVTSEMGLDLLDVADAIRPHPAVVALLRRAEDDTFVDRLVALAGGQAVHDAIVRWLDAYGMRGAGEIDITRPRWRERPFALLPILLRHVDRFEPGESARRRERGRREATARAAEVLGRVRALPGGERKAAEVQHMIARVRAFIGYREYPKYGMIRRYGLYRQALLAEAGRLVRNGVLEAADDVFYLRFDELEEVVRVQRADQRLVSARREAFESHQRLVPPRVFTSDGETIVGAYRRGDVPAGALAGLTVSAGCVEGRARVILDIAAADLEPGDIIVTTYTDPSWTPLFVGIAGLVTEVGGLMTHGAVIAREYGLPAIVGVEQATLRIRDGQRIRLQGTHGYVELLS